MQTMPKKAPRKPVQPPIAEPIQNPIQMPAGPSLGAQALSAPSEMDARDAVPVIGKAQIDKAFETWQTYKTGRQTLTSRIQKNELWWRMQHASNPNDPANADTNSIEKISAWLVNAVWNKHAEARDNYPEASILPREKSDEPTAKLLAAVLPVLFEQIKFENVWSDEWWRKLKLCAAVYGVFWNGQKQNGIGDLDIKGINLLNLYWEPGIHHIQDSANVFHVEYWDNRELELAYPQLKGKVGSTQELPEHDRDDNTENKNNRSMVFDWYYKGKVGAQTVVHLCKFACGQVLFASENKQEPLENGIVPDYSGGYYKHGKYPFVVDNFFPIETDIVGFCYLDIIKSAQEHIDALGADIAANTRMRSKVRYVIAGDSPFNEAELADYTKNFIHIPGNSVDESKLREIKPDALGPEVINWYNMLINELKETAGNQDVNTGAKPSGVTAASAIAALQEAGSKLSRDMLKASYCAVTEIYEMSIEIIRQFYGAGRFFRIAGPNGTDYQKLDNSILSPDFLGGRTPYFDIKIKPQKANPYSKAAQNEFAMELYGKGFFNPQMADQALPCVEMMDFDGKEEVRQTIAKNGTMMQAIQQIMSLVPDLPPEIGAAIVGAAGPNFAAMVPQMPAQQQGGGQTKVNSLGGIQPANKIADRVKKEVGSRSDPNGGKA